MPGDYLALNSIGFADLFIRNKENWRESECSHSCSDEVKNVYSHKNSADDFLARRETTLLAGKPNTSCVKMYYFMICITCKSYTR